MYLSRNVYHLNYHISVLFMVGVSVSTNRDSYSPFIAFNDGCLLNLGDDAKVCLCSC